MSSHSLPQFLLTFYLFLVCNFFLNQEIFHPFLTKIHLNMPISAFLLKRLLKKKSQSKIGIVFIHVLLRMQSVQWKSRCDDWMKGKGKNYYEGVQEWNVIQKSRIETLLKKNNVGCNQGEDNVGTTRSETLAKKNMNECIENEMKMIATRTEAWVKKNRVDCSEKEGNVGTSGSATLVKKKLTDCEGGNEETKLEPDEKLDDKMLSDAQVDEGLRLIELLEADIDAAMSNLVTDHRCQ